MDYVKGFDGVWLPRPIDVVEYWRSEYKPVSLQSHAGSAPVEAAIHS